MDRMQHIRCDNCGTDNPDDVSECLYCGRPLVGTSAVRHSSTARYRRPIPGCVWGLAAVPIGFLVLYGLPVLAYVAVPFLVILALWTLWAARAPEPPDAWKQTPAGPVWDWMYTAIAVLACAHAIVSSIMFSRGLMPPTMRSGKFDACESLWYASAGLLVLSLLMAAAARSTGRRVASFSAFMAAWLAFAAGLALPIHCREVAGIRKGICLSNTKDLSLALLMYAEDNGVLPSADAWCDSLSPYLKNPDIFRCPEAPDADCAYAFNSSLSEAALADITDPASMILLFESDRGWNVQGGPELLPVEARHLRGDNYGFAGGHAAWLHRDRILSGDTDYTWSPAAEHKEPPSDLTN